MYDLGRLNAYSFHTSFLKAASRGRQEYPANPLTTKGTNRGDMGKPWLVPSGKWFDSTLSNHIGFAARKAADYIGGFTHEQNQMAYAAAVCR